MTVARYLSVLRELGAEAERLDRCLELEMDADEILHAEPALCRAGTTFERRVQLLDVLQRLCPLCTTGLATMIPGELTQVFKIAEFAGRSDLSPDVLELRELLRRCAVMFDWLRRKPDAGGGDAVVNVTRRLALRYEQLKAALRTDDATEQVRTLVLPAGAVEDRTPVLAGIRGYNPRKNPDDLGDLIVASCWVGLVRGGNFVLATTADVAAVLGGRVLPDPAYLDAVVPVPGAQVAQLAETTAGLWQPKTGENLEGFADAVQTARMLLSV